MAILLSILLIALGLLGAERTIVEKVPAAKGFLASLSDYRDIIGFLGILAALVSLVLWLGMLSNILLYKFAILLALAADAAMLALGLILGLDFIKKNITSPTAPLIVKAEIWRAKILPYQLPISLAAIAIGIVCLIRILNQIV